MKEKKKGSLFSFSRSVQIFFMFFLVSSINLILYESYERQVQGNDYVLFVIVRNVLVLSVFFSLIEVIQKKITIEIPVKRILDNVEKISQGDFGIQIVPLNTKRVNEFDDIIDGINKMARALTEVETMKTDFISNVSHEIKTPLAVIQNYATMLQNDNLTMEERIFPDDCGCSETTFRACDKYFEVKQAGESGDHPKERKV